MRFSLNTLLIIVFLVAAYFPLSHALQPWQEAREALLFPGFSNLVSLSEIHDGDSFEYVASKIETLKLAEPGSDERGKLEAIAKTAGVIFEKATDFYLFESQGFHGMLLFQNGKLVNHDVAVAENPFTKAMQIGIPTPSIWFRLGILPIYALCAVVLLAVGSQRNRLSSKNSRDQVLQ